MKPEAIDSDEVVHIGSGRCDKCQQQHDYVITLSSGVKLCRACAESEPKTDGAAPVISTPLLGQLRDECHKALRCLYIAVDVPVADEVSTKVKAYITELERSASIRPNTHLDTHVNELHNLGNDLEEWCEVRVRKDLIPKSAILVEAYLTDREVIVMGRPPESDDEETGHNCDAMGCGTLSHVIYRIPLPVSLTPLLCSCQKRIQEALSGTIPSDGHDWVDEIIGLLRVARSQRDLAERQLVKHNTEVSSGSKTP